MHALDSLTMRTRTKNELASWIIECILVCMPKQTCIVTMIYSTVYAKTSMTASSVALNDISMFEVCKLFSKSLL